MNRLNKILILCVACLIACQLFAQNEKLGGVYYAYPIESGNSAPEILPAPEGYEILLYLALWTSWLPLADE